MTSSDSTAFPAILGRAAFWPALYPEGSRFCGQIPALFWLMETLRPATTLGLGLVTGEGYFALCQAIHDLGVQSLAWGFGAWDGAVPEPLRQHNATHYADFSRLARMPSAPELASRFEDELFDLILVDGRGLQAVDTADWATLLRRLASPRGLVLLQGTSAPDDGTPPSPAAALLAELAARHPVLRFDAQTDCTLILTGSTPLPHLKAMAEAPAPQAEVAALERLGASHLLAWKARESAKEQAARQADLTACRQEAANLRAAVSSHDARLATVTANLAENQDRRQRDVRVLTLQLESLTEKLRQTEAALSAIRDAETRSELPTFDPAACRDQLAEAETTHLAEIAVQHRQIAGLEQALKLRDQTISMQEAHIAALRHDAVQREALHQVQLKLRDWQQARLSEKPRFGGLLGPSGGKLADEVTAVARHPLFDAGWYQSSYPDIQGSALSAVEHFLRHGFYEGRDPGPRLRLLDWFAANPQALAARQNPLLDPDLRL